MLLSFLPFSGPATLGAFGTVFFTFSKTIPASFLVSHVTSSVAVLAVLCRVNKGLASINAYYDVCSVGLFYRLVPGHLYPFFYLPFLR